LALQNDDIYPQEKILIL